jgi:tetraacyldisaccharide-1-P 4'-kinase
LTEKDAVKLRPDRADAARLWVATLDFRLSTETVQGLLSLLATAPTR